MVDSPLSVIKSAMPNLSGLRILDVGCGDGKFAKLLTGEAASATGIDPNPAAVENARSLVPEAKFVVGSAESLPFGDSSFDVVIFVNALHHVPAHLMAAALRESSRVLTPGGYLIVIEPLAQGSFFEAMRPVEDEAEVRLAVQVALKEVARSGHFKSIKSLSYVRREIFDDADHFLRRIVSVDPSRQQVANHRRLEVAATLERLALKTAEGKLSLDQPIQADILESCQPDKHSTGG